MGLGFAQWRRVDKGPRRVLILTKTTVLSPKMTSFVIQVARFRVKILVLQTSASLLILYQVYTRPLKKVNEVRQRVCAYLPRQVS